MSFQHQHDSVCLTDHPKPSSTPQPDDVLKIDKMEKIKELAKCSRCLKNYSRNTRAPICVPCGHSLCRICIQSLIYDNIICCSICQSVKFFGPKELGKNIQLLDILESLELLDTDDKTSALESTSSSALPSTIFEAVADTDLRNFFSLNFSFIKKLYLKKQNSKIAVLIMREFHDNRHFHQTEEQAVEVYHTTAQLRDALDKVLLEMNVCFRIFNPLNDDNNDVSNDPIPDADSDNDPFGIEFMMIDSDELESSSPSSVDEAFNFLNDYNSANDEDDNDSDVDAPDDSHFQPGDWNPLSKLFDLPRIKYNNRL